MKRAPVDARTPNSPRSRRRSIGAVAVLGACALILSACGGDDDDTSDTTPTTLSTNESSVTTTTRATPTTVATTTTTLPPLELVTEGASIVVANASGINGAAGRMTDALAVVGFATGEATNSSEGQIETSKVYYDPDNENAKAVADSLREALGGGDIEVVELAVPAPTESGEIGEASIVLAMGNDTADKSLDELQGRVPPAEEEPSDDTTPDDTTSDDTTPDDTTSDDTTPDDTTGEDTSDS